MAQGLEQTVMLPVLADDIGFDVNEQFKVIKVMSGSPAVGKLAFGDVVTSVNQKPPLNRTQLMTMVAASKPRATLRVRRDCLVTATLKNCSGDKQQYEVHMQWKQGVGASIGLFVKDIHDHVVVSGTQEGSLSSMKLKQGDILCEINGSKVSTRQVARQLITQGLRATGRIKLLVERDANASRVQVFTANSGPPSAGLPSDTIDIMNDMREQLEMQRLHPPTVKPALRQLPPQTPAKNIFIRPRHDTVDIRSDLPTNARVQATPKRYP